MNNQFRVALTEHVTHLYNLALDNFIDAENELKQYPRSNNAKTRWQSSLTEKLAFRCILTHINDGRYDDKEYYEKYIKK
jgi:Ni,Fe-hydrogenase I large subunit